MPRANRLKNDRLYSEAEAAAALCISIARLHQLLDEHIFTAGNPRPPALQFTSNDVLLLGYWSGSSRSTKHEVITMPKRN